MTRRDPRRCESVGDRKGKPAWQRYRTLPLAVWARELDAPTTVRETQGQAGDFLIRGIDGELHPCKAEIFLRTYERITSRALKHRVVGTAGTRQKKIGLDAYSAPDGRIVFMLSRLAESIELSDAEALKLAARITQACAEVT